MPNLTVIIPTVGRNTLTRTLDSIVGQRLQEDDQVLVCGDDNPTASKEMDLPLGAWEHIVTGLGPQFKFHRLDAGEGTWGNAQRNAMIPLATSEWVLFQDDDDIFMPCAFDTIRMMATVQEKHGSNTEKVPMYFRYEGPSGVLFWRKAGDILRNEIGGHSIVAPNGPRLAAWGDGYSGDWDYVARTSKNFKDLGFWHPHILSAHKPPLGWIEATTKDHAEAMRLIRNECRATLSRNTDEISKEQQQAWFAGLDPVRMYPYLFYAEDQIIGYGMLSIREDNLPWVTVCVREQFRGKHYGRFIFKALSYAFPLPVYAEIRRDNIPSLKACLGAGFKVEEASLRFTVLRSTTQERPLEDQPR